MMRFVFIAVVMVAMGIGLFGCNFESRKASDSKTEIVADHTVPVTKIKRQRTDHQSKLRGNSTAKSIPTRHRTRAEDRKATEPTVMVYGTVKFENGTPITSATVELWRDRSGALGRLVADHRLDVSPVDNDGGYAVYGRDGLGLRVEVKGLSRVMADINYFDTGSTVAVVRKVEWDFKIPTPAVVTGRVTNANDEPVTSALVSLQTEKAGKYGPYYGNQQTTVSATGDFVLNGIAGGKAIIGAIADGFSPSIKDITVPTSGPVILRLTTGSATLNGTVLMYPGNAPVANARIECRPSGKSATLGLGDKITAHATTDYNGAFTIGGLSSGVNQISFSDSDGNELFRAPGEIENAFTFSLDDNQTTAITFMVFSGYSVSGMIYDKDTSEPLSGARVLLGNRKKVEQEMISKDDGTYRFTRVGALGPSVALNAKLTGYAVVPGKERVLMDNNPIAVKMPDKAESVGNNIAMIPIVRVSGRVENQDGLPVAGANVSWSGSADSADPNSSLAVTDAKGAFSIIVMPLQRGLLNVTAEGYAGERTETMQVSDQDLNGVVIILETEATVDGKVVDPDDEPVAGAQVTTMDTYSFDRSTFSVINGLGISDSNGDFHGDGLGAGKIILTAGAKGYNKGMETVNLAAGENKSGIIIKLNEEISIEGQIVDSKNKGLVAQVSSLSSYSGGGMPFVMSDENGNFKLTGVVDKKQNIMASTDEPKRQKVVEAEPGIRDLVIVLEDGAIMHCKVVDALTGKPIEQFDVTGYDRNFTKGDGPGEFSFSLAAGQQTSVRVTADDYAAKSFPVKAPDDGQDKSFTLEMGIGAAVSGRVISMASGKPEPNVPVTAREEEGAAGTLSTTVSDSDGKFLISKIPSGKVTVKAIPAAPMAPAEKTAELKDGEFTDIGDIAIDNAGSIHGRVLMNSRQFAGFQTVNLGGPKGDSSQAQFQTLSSDGTYKFASLLPGSYSVSWNRHIQTVDLKAGDDLEVNFNPGNITVQGSISGRETTQTGILARNIQIGSFVSGSVKDDNRYTLSELEPADYEITITGSFAGPDGKNVSRDVHSEVFTVPDQETVTKDFVIP